MDENYPEATNFQYVDGPNTPVLKNIFINDVNSYHGSALVKKILNEIEPDEGLGEKFTFEIYGTRQKGEECGIIPGVKILNPGRDSFLESVSSCDIIILDISQDFSQLSEAKKGFEIF